MKHKGILVVVSGFSGAGKGTLMKKLVSQYDYALSVSMTTRAPRVGEEEGVSYYFVSRPEFEEAIADKQLVEYAEYCGNYYGTPRAYVQKQLDAGRDVVLEIEIQGALQVKEMFPDALLLFVTAPSAKELERRLRGRGTEEPEVIRARMQRAAEEARGIENYDMIVVNDDLDVCVQQMHQIIRAAHWTTSRNTAFIENMRDELNTLLKGEK